jgi:hypothetical protein
MAYDYAGARAAGLTDDQINDYLSKKHQYNIGGAREAGLRERDITKYLLGKESPAKPVEEAPSEGGLGTDVLKGLGAVGTSITSSLPAAVGAPVRVGAREVPTAPLNIAESLFTGNILDKIQEHYGLKKKEQKAPETPVEEGFQYLQEKFNKPLQQASDLAASELYIPGARKAAELGREVSKDLMQSMTPESREAIAKSQIGTPEFLGGEGFIGEDASARGLGLQFLNVVASVAPLFVAGVVTKDPNKVAALGQAMSTGEGMNAAIEYIGSLSNEELARRSPEFVELVKQYGPEEARRLLISKVADQAGVAQGVVGRFGGQVLGKLFSGQFDDAILKAFKTRAGAIAGTGTAVGVQQGVEEAAEGLASDIGIDKSVVKEVGADVFANMVWGALGGKPLGMIQGARAKLDTGEKAKDEGKPAFMVDPVTGNLVPVKEEAPAETTETTAAAPLTKQGELFTKEEAPFQVTPGEVSVEAQARQEQSDRAQEQIVALQQQLAQTTDPQQAAAIRDDISKLEPLVQETGQQKAVRLGQEFVTLYRKGTTLSEQKAALEVERNAEKTLDGKKLITEQIKAIENQIAQIATRQEEIEVEGKKLEKEGVTFDRTKDELDLKGPSPIVGNVMSKFGLPPRVPVRQRIKNLDMTDPAERAKFEQEIFEFDVNNPGKVNLEAVQAYIDAFTPAQQEVQSEPGTVSDVGTRASQPSFPLLSGQPRAAEGTAAPAAQGLASVIPALGGPLAGTGIVPSVGPGALTPTAGIAPPTGQGQLELQTPTTAEDLQVGPPATMVNTPNPALADMTDPASEWDQVAQGNVLPAYSNLPEAAKAEWAASDRDVIAAQNIFEKYIKQIDAISDAQKRLQNADIHNELSTNEKQVIAEHYGEDSYNDVVKSKFVQDVVTALTQGLDKVAAVLRNIIKRLQAGALAAVIAINASAMSPPIHFAIPAVDVKTEVVMAQVPVQAAAKMSDGAKRAYGVLYPAMKQYLQENNKLFIMTDKPSARMFIFNPDGSLLLERKILLGSAFGDYYKGNTDIRANRITPAGLFTMSIRQNNATAEDYDFQTVFGLDQVEDGSSYFVTTMHSVWMNERDNQQRVAALQTEGSADARMSFGCVNIDKPTFAYLFENHLEQINGAKTFIVPDNPADTMSFINGEAVKSKDMVRDKADLVTKTVKTPKPELKAQETGRAPATRREDFVTAAPLGGRETTVEASPIEVSAVASVQRSGNITGNASINLVERIADGDLKGALQEIVNNTTGIFSEIEQEVANAVLQSRKLPTVEVVDSLPNNDSGQYDATTDTIKIVKGEVDSHSVLHESVHGFLHGAIQYFEDRMAKGLDVNKDFKRLKDIFDYLVKNHPELSEQYGMKSLSEFASEVMSNMQFQTILNGIKYENSNTYTEFAKRVFNLLGIKSGADSTVLAESLIAVQKLMPTGRAMQEKGIKGVDIGIAPMKRTPTDEGKELLARLNKTGGMPPKPSFKFRFPRFRRDTQQVDDDYKQNSLWEDIKAGALNIFSFDDAYNNAVRKELLKLADEGKITLDQALLGLRRVDVTQVVHRGQIATEAINTGKTVYDPITNRYRIEAADANMDALKRHILALSERTGITIDEALAVVSKAIEANRVRDVYEKLDKLTGDITRTEKKIDLMQANRKRTKDEDKQLAKARELLKKLKDEQELNRDRVQHMTRAQVQEGMKDFNDLPETKEAFAVWMQMRKYVIDELVRSGVTSEEKAERWLSEMAYVPFFRDISEQRGIGMQIMKKGLGESMAEYGFKGSMLPVENTIGNMYQWMHWSYARAISNQHLRVALDQMMVLYPDMIKEGPGPKGTTFSVYVDGQRKQYTVANAAVAKMFIETGSVLFPSVKLGRKYVELFVKGITRIPGFSTSQLFLKDAWEAASTSGVKNPYGIVKNVFFEIGKTALGVSEARKELKARGTLSTREHAMASQYSTEMSQRLELKDPGVYRMTMNFLDKFSALNDNMLRQAVYQQLVSEGKTKDEAADRATEIFNYRRSSGSSLVQTLTNFVPFLNAFAISGRVAARTVSGKGITAQTRAEGAKTLATTQTLLIAGSLMYLMAVGDSEEYKRMNRMQRDTSFVIPGTNLVIPIRNGWFAMNKIIAEYTYNLLANEAITDTQMFKDALYKAFKKQFEPPIGGIVVAPIGLALNKDIFNNKDIVNKTLDGLESEYQMDKNTSELAKYIGHISGMSPLKLDYFFNAFFGMAMPATAWMTNDLIADARGIPRPSQTALESIAKIPTVGQFISKEDKSGSAADFYAAARESDKSLRSIKKLAETDTGAAQTKLTEDEDKLTYTEGMKRALEGLNRRENIIRNTPTFTTEKGVRKPNTFVIDGKEVPVTSETKAKLIKEIEEQRKGLTKDIVAIRKKVFN